MVGGDARRGTLVIHYVADQQRPPLDLTLTHIFFDG